MTALRCINELGAANLGLVRRTDLREQKLSAATVRRLVRDRALTPLTPQVLLIGPGPATWEQRAQAALWQAGPDAALSYGAAAYWLGLAGFGPGAIEVSIPVGRAIPRRTIGAVHRDVSFTSDVVGVTRGLPVTLPSRTITDLACRVRSGRLLEVLQDACRRNLVRLPDELPVFDVRYRPGRQHLAEAVAKCVDAGELASWLEQRFRDLVDSARLPRPRVQRRLTVQGARYRVDFIWDDLGLVVETDGYASHSTREQQNADAQRRTRLMTEGFQVVNFTYDQVVHEPEFVVANLRLLIERLRALKVGTA